MSENLSIDEIIKRAEKIKQEAELHLEAAEKRLDEKAKEAVNEVVASEEDIIQIVDSVQYEEEVKEFKPSSKTAFDKTEETGEEEVNDGKTRSIKIESDDKTKDIASLEKTRISPAIKSNEKTKRMSFVSTKADDSENDGLEKIPTIVASDEISGFEKEEEQELGVQIKFAGFDDKIESVPKIDEELAERELAKRRKEKVGKFRLFGPDETDEELGDNTIVDDDYEEESEKSSFVNSLISKRNSIWRKIVITVVLGIPLLLMTVLYNSTYLPDFLSSHSAYFGFASVIYGLIVLVNLNIITHGFTIKKAINFDFPISVGALLIFAHTILLAAKDALWVDNGILLASAGTLSLFMSQLGKYNMTTRIIDNFEFISDGSQKYTVENITNSVDAEVISRGLVENNGMLKISVKCDFPTNFLEISCKNEPADRLAKRMFGFNALFSLALLLAVGLIDNFNTGINVSLSAFIISLPSSALFLSNNILSDISSQLSAYNSRVCGFEGAAMTSDAAAVVMEAADLFDKHSCDLHGIKTFGGAKVDDAIIHAAAVIVQTKSPLAHVFDDVIIGQQSILPKVDGVTYEENLGTSAWIYKRKVLVGTRELLKMHGVNVPRESFEKKYTIKERKALYLAVGGKIMAMFIVSYNADPDLKHELRKLEKSGTTLIVKSADPYINEHSLAELFEIPEGFIRVMNYSAARVYERYSNMAVEKSPAYLVHNGSALGFISAMRGGGIIQSTKGLVNFLVIFGSALGFAVVALLSILQTYSQITTLSIILFQAIWTVFVFFISKMRSLGL